MQTNNLLDITPDTSNRFAQPRVVRDVLARMSSKGDVALIKPTQWAYAAGILDGEGCITIRQCKRRGTELCNYYLMVIVSQNGRRLADWHAALFGGRVHAINDKSSRNVNFQWHMNGRRAAVFLRGVAPYAVLKRDQVELALAFQERLDTLRQAPEEQEIRETMRSQLKAMKTAHRIPTAEYFPNSASGAASVCRFDGLGEL